MSDDRRGGQLKREPSEVEARDWRHAMRTDTKPHFGQWTGPNKVSPKADIGDVKKAMDNGNVATPSVARQLPTPALTPTFLADIPFANLPPLPDFARAHAAPELDVPGNPYGKEHTPPPFDRFPTFPASPSPRKPRPSLPLCRLFRAGTIVLADHHLNPALRLAEDGWTLVSKDLVSPSRNEAEDHVVEPLPQDFDEPSQSPSKGRKRGRAGGRGKHPSAKKRAKVVVDKLLDNIIACSQAYVLQASARADGTNVIFRIYLVPEDLPELGKLSSKDRLKRPPPSILRSVLESIRCDATEWIGQVGVEQKRFMEEEDSRSLLEIFHDVEAPGTGGFDSLDASRHVKDRLWSALHVQPDEIKTELFPYQRGSVAKMLARELAPAERIMPNYLRRACFLDSSDQVFVSLEGHVALSPPRVKEAKSGILAEDMGVGKTIISLALIMATRSELPALDGVSTWLDGSFPSAPPILLTRQSIDFPFEAERQERLRLRNRVPELLHGALEVMSVVELEEYESKLERQRQADLEALAHHPPLPSLRTLMINHVKTTPHQLRYHVEDPLLSGGDLYETLQSSPPFYRLYPSPSSLNSREGRRGDLKPVDIVVAATTLIVVPTDLVRQWSQEIEKHLEPGSLRVLCLRTSKDKFRSPQEMATFDVVLMSAARFTDAAETGDRSLRGIHWKRLLVDEGHVLSSGNLTRKLAEELRCESKFAVSGTPTTNLRGASVDGKLAAASNIVGGTREDLDRLGQLFSRFLHHPAFPRPQSLRQLVGEHPSRLANVFNDSIIRNPTDVVKSKLGLPELSVRVVHVEMEEAERKMYNVLTAFFASNAIQSQREDQDYFFHKANSAPLNELCSNLASASTFFSSDSVGAQVRNSQVWAQQRLDSDKAAKWSEDDKRGQTKAIAVLKEASDDKEWNVVVNEFSVAVEVDGLDEDIVKAFGGLRATSNPLKRSLVSLKQLVRLRQDLRELLHLDVKGWNDDEELVEELITFEARRKRYDVEVASRKSKDDDEIIPVFKKRSKKDTTPLAPLPIDSMFANVQLVRTSSAKINYLLDQFRSFPDEKFIVFSSSRPDLLFANLSEALDLFAIPHIIFASSHARMGQDRGLKAQRFNSTTAKEVQVILVDAEKGGRGVGLTAASRVIFLEPVWRPDLELQATKRAHRLGQTRPVDLQILIVKDTYEDAMFQRRAQIAPEDFSKKVKLPQQDSSLKSLLQSAKYLDPTVAAQRGVPVSKALLDPPVRPFRTEGGHDVSRD